MCVVCYCIKLNVVLFLYKILIYILMTGKSRTSARVCDDDDYDFLVFYFTRSVHIHYFLIGTGFTHFWNVQAVITQCIMEFCVPSLTDKM